MAGAALQWSDVLETLRLTHLAEPLCGIDLSEAFDMAGEWELDDAGTVHDMIVVFHPTDLYPYSMRYKNSGDTYLAPFQMPRKRIVFQPNQNVPFTAHLWDQRGIIALDNQRYVRRKLLESLPPLSAPLGTLALFPALALRSLL